MSTKARVSRALGAVLLAGGALLASAPGATAGAGGASADLPAPAAPTVVSAVASGDPMSNVATIKITVRWQPDNFTHRNFGTTANGVALPANPLSVQESGNSAVITWRLCWTIVPAPTLECSSQAELDMQVGSPVSVKMQGFIVEPETPMLISEVSKSSNTVRIVQG